MRSSLYRVLSSVMFGLSLCACVLLLSPSIARADVLDLNLEYDQIRIYEEPTITSSEASESDVRALSTYQKFQPELDNILNDYTIYRIVTKSPFTAYSSVISNCLMALYIPLGSTIIPKDYKIRISIPSYSWAILPYVNDSTSWVDISCNVQSVWVGTSISSLSKCTFSNGGYVAPKAGSLVMVLFNTGARTAGRLGLPHYYELRGTPKLYVEIPDPTAQRINDQSIINTEQITTSQQEQTDTLMDTTGSNSVMDTENMDAYRRFYNQLGPVGQLSEVANQLRNATNTTVTSDIVLFPGISLMGFTIPAQQVTITDKMIGLVERIRWITTFCFVAMFVRYLRAFVAAVFGTEEIGLWVSRDEDVEVQQDNIRGFRALSRYYNTDVHHHGRIYR